MKKLAKSTPTSQRGKAAPTTQPAPLPKRGEASPTSQPVPAGHEALSSDEAALAQAMAQIAKQYGEDASQQAWLDCAEAANGGPFPISILAQRAKALYEQERRQEKRHKAYHVGMAHDPSVMPEVKKQRKPDGREELYRADSASPEAQAIARDSLRHVEADAGGRLMIERELSDETLENARSNGASRATKRLVHLKKQKIYGARHGRRRAVRSICRRQVRATWR